MGRAGRPSLLGPLLAVLLCQAIPAAAWAQQPDASDERQALIEANKTLQDEIKLAARPQTYLLVDVAQGIVLLKARGVEVHRLAILSWQAPENRPPAGLFRLTARPPVDRPKTKPGEDATEHPIELADMPAEYQLPLAPAATLLVAPPLQDHPWLRLRSFLREWWLRGGLAAGSIINSDSKPAPQWLRLSLSTDQARSLAWSATDNMPVLIGRTTVPDRKSP